MSDASTYVDLFGVNIPEPAAPLAAGAKKKRNDKPRGNAAPIGSGPAGETCKTCVHSYCSEYAKRYWKCDLVKATHGPGSDIRLKWHACSRFEKRTETKA